MCFSLVPSVRVKLGYLAWRCSGSEEQGISYGLLIVWIGRSALDPDISTFEKFMLPDGSDLFYSLDHIAAGRKGIGPMRRSHSNNHTSLTDLQGSQSVMEGYPDCPPVSSFLDDARKGAQGERFISLVLQS